MFRTTLSLLFLVILMTACGPGSTSEPVTAPTAIPTDTSQPPPTRTLAPTATPIPATNTPQPVSEASDPDPTATPVPTDTPAPTDTPELVDWTDFESVSADGFYERGNPDAPILILDYSDFL